MFLQLFAAAQKTNQNTTEHTRTESGSSTVGGSHSESDTTSERVGGSTSTTVGHSQTNSDSYGGAHSDSAGKSWASGKVEDQTQAQRDKYNTDYQQNQKVQDTYDRLQATLDQKPQFQSQYENKLNELYDSILNRDKFSYNFNADPMYQMYKDKYTQQGKTAMEDTLGRANAMNGGYGSSYAQSAGQQTYQNYLNELNNVIPTLRNQAYQEYQDEQQRMLQNYQLTNDAYNREYGQYRDSVSDWQADRSFNQSAYQDERNFDYNQFANERNYWNQEYWNEKNAEQSNIASSDSTNWNKAQSTTDSISQTDQKYWENAHSHTTTDSTNWSNTSAWSDTTSTQNIENIFSAAAGGGSSSSSRSSSGGGTTEIPQLKTPEAPKGEYWNQSDYTNRIVGSGIKDQVDAQNMANANNSQQNNAVTNALVNGGYAAANMGYQAYQTAQLQNYMQDNNITNATAQDLQEMRAEYRSKSTTSEKKAFENELKNRYGMNAQALSYIMG